MAAGQPDQQQPMVPSDAPDSAGTPGPFRKAISTGMIEAGFGLLGSAFAGQFNDPAIGQQFQQMGSNISATLMDRWYKKEYEDFVATNGQAYKDRLQELQKRTEKTFNMINRGVYTDPETGVTQKIKPGGDEASFIRENLQRTMYGELSQITQGYMSAAAKYSNNPYVNAEIAGVIKAQSDEINNKFGPAITTAQEVQRQEMRLKREQAGYYSRVPQPDSGSDSQAHFKAMTVRELIEEKGLTGAANYLSSTLDGQERLNPYKAGLEANLDRQIEAQAQAEGRILLPDVKSKLMVSKSKDVQSEAVGQALIEALGADDPNLQAFFGSRVGAQYSPRKTATTSAIDPRQVPEMTEAAVAQAKDLIENAMQMGATPEEAVSKTIAQASAQLTSAYGNTPQTKKIKSALINRLTQEYASGSKEEDQGEDLPQPKKGLLPTYPGTNIRAIK